MQELYYANENVERCFQNFAVMQVIRKYLSEETFGIFVCALQNPTKYPFDLCIQGSDDIITVGMHFF